MVVGLLLLFTYKNVLALIWEGCNAPCLSDEIYNKYARGPYFKTCLTSVIPSFSKSI